MKKRTQEKQKAKNAKKLKNMEEIAENLEKQEWAKGLCPQLLEFIQNKLPLNFECADNYLTKNAKVGLRVLPVSLLNKMRILIEKLTIAITISKRGVAGLGDEVCIDVLDSEMPLFMEVFNGDWKNWDHRNVIDTKHTWKTTNKDAVLSLLRSFKCFEEFCLSKTFFTAPEITRFKPVPIDDSKSLRQNIKEIKVEHKLYPKFTPTIVEYTIELGPFPTPFSLAEERRNRKKPPKNIRPITIGKFTIQYDRCYPINESGILKFNCRYLLNSGGLLDRN